MTYAAPRQMTFALIVLMSFCLHVLAFVAIGEQKIRKTNQQEISHMAVNLGSELGSALARNDKVSMSVIAQRYMDHKVEHLAIYDSQGTLLVPMGQEGKGDVLSQDIIYEGKLLGRADIQGQAISRARLLADYWLLLLAIATLHFLLFLLYGHVARPTTRMIDDISANVRNHLLANGLLSSVTGEMSPVTQAPEKPSAEQVAAESPTKNDEFGAYSQDFMTQFVFVDPHNLLSALSHDVAEAYFALCTQLLNKCVNDVLAEPKLQGVVVTKIVPFGNEGARVYLGKSSDGAPIAIATAMITKLMPMLNQIVHDKHRELSYFALPIRAMASDSERVSIARELLNKYKHTSMILLTNKDKSQVASSMNLFASKNPQTIHERECYSITEVSDEMAAILLRLRNQILLNQAADDIHGKIS